MVFVKRDTFGDLFSRDKENVLGACKNEKSETILIYQLVALFQRVLQKKQKPKGKIVTYSQKEHHII